MSNEHKELEDYLASLPGIGPRQARRILYYLLRKESRFSKRIGELVGSVKSNTKLCQRTFHYFYSSETEINLSPIALDQSRDHSKIIIVETDPDLENIESTELWKGSYFVLGGTVRPSTATEKYESYIRLADLNRTLASEHNNTAISEVIFGLSSSVNGDFTTEVLKKQITADFPTIKQSTLGRGLSTGTSLEYVDKTTLQQALDHRS